MIPCLCFEDDHLLVVNKPAGWNTHAPSPFAGEGLYDWLRHREPRWASLAIIHRLDKETSGLLVFAKSVLANRSLTEQFTRRLVKKKYVLITDRKAPTGAITVESVLARHGSRYKSQAGSTGDVARTSFRWLRTQAGRSWMEARPETGRTHQIRVQAAESGWPILGDLRYGGSAAARVFLHAEELDFQHPDTRQPVHFCAPAHFDEATPLALRSALIDPQETDAYRCLHGGADAWPGWYVDSWGTFGLSASELPLDSRQMAFLQEGMRTLAWRGVYHKTLRRDVRQADSSEAAPQRVLGDPAPDEFTIRENGVRYAVRLGDGYSVGLFLDQRDNRRRLLKNHVAREFPLRPGGLTGLDLLNTFAYTCGFSLCAARVGARTTSIDLSARYLEWGRRNFELNAVDPRPHEFLQGEVFNWLRRLARKQRSFDVILLDPPTFSSSKEHRIFRAEKDLGELVGAALPLLRREGILFVSTNAARLSPEAFLRLVTGAIQTAGRTLLRQHYAPQPPDFPITREEPGHLKTVWLRIR